MNRTEKGIMLTESSSKLGETTYKSYNQQQIITNQSIRQRPGGCHRTVRTMADGLPPVVPHVETLFSLITETVHNSHAQEIHDILLAVHKIVL